MYGMSEGCVVRLWMYLGKDVCMYMCMYLSSIDRCVSMEGVMSEVKYICR